MRCVVATLTLTILLSLSASSADGARKSFKSAEGRGIQSSCTSNPSRTIHTEYIGIFSGLMAGHRLFGLPLDHLMISVYIALERPNEGPVGPLEDGSPPGKREYHQHVDLDEDPWEEAK